MYGSAYPWSWGDPGLPLPEPATSPGSTQACLWVDLRLALGQPGLVPGLT